jgi:hypothetical protein
MAERDSEAHFGWEVWAIQYTLFKSHWQMLRCGQAKSYQTLEVEEYKENIIYLLTAIGLTPDGSSRVHS